MDTLSPEERSERMSRVRGKDTGPEWAVRQLVHSMGYRYRLHARDLPGRPDLVFRGRRKVHAKPPLAAIISRPVRCEELKRRQLKRRVP